MSEQFKSPDMQAYFSSLPIYVQETIKQTAIEVQTTDELQKIAQNMMS